MFITTERQPLPLHVSLVTATCKEQLSLTASAMKQIVNVDERCAAITTGDIIAFCINSNPNEGVGLDMVQFSLRHLGKITQPPMSDELMIAGVELFLNKLVACPDHRTRKVMLFNFPINIEQAKYACNRFGSLSYLNINSPSKGLNAEQERARQAAFVMGYRSRQFGKITCNSIGDNSTLDERIAMIIKTANLPEDMEGARMRWDRRWLDVRASYVDKAALRKPAAPHGRALLTSIIAASVAAPTSTASMTAVR